MNVHITEHAKARMQQRGVSQDVLGLLMKYGRRAHAGKGAQIVYFDKRARKRLRRDNAAEPVSRDSKQLNSYAVCKGKVILTAGKLYKRVRNQ